MLSPEYLDRVADDAIEIYQMMQEDVCKDIARRMAQPLDKGLSTSLEQTRLLQENGALFGDVVASVARYSGLAEDTVRRTLWSAFRLSVVTDRNLFLKAGIDVPALLLSETAATIFEANVRKVAESAIERTVTGLHNLTLTMAENACRAYIEASSVASLEISNGITSYRSAIPKAIKSVADKGLAVSYPSGHVDTIEVATRRAVMTGVNQTAGEISKMMADEFQCDLMEITAHANARPDHAKWQGKVVSLSGRKGYLSLDDIGYGTGAGFMGWNCRHSWNPFFEGISKPAWGKDELEALNKKELEYNGNQYTQYEMSQLMRETERNIRGEKRALVALDEVLQQKDIDGFLREELQRKFDTESYNLYQLRRKYDDLCTVPGNINAVSDYKAYTYGFGVAQSNRANAAAKRQIRKMEEIAKV